MKNILFILPDQMRADFVGCYGANFAKTPNLDKLAANGTRYTRCVSPSPLCVPARASLLTGENALTNGVMDNGKWLRPDHEACGLHSWPAILSAQGYETVGIGKMHFYPWDISEGFDKRIIAEDKRHTALQDDYALAMQAAGLKKYHGQEVAGYQETKGAIECPLPDEFQVDNWVAQQACDYIKAHDGEKPFALMVGFGSPHCPYDPPKADCDLFAEGEMPTARPTTPESEAFYQMMRASCLNDWCNIDYNGFTAAQKAIIRTHYSGLIHRIDDCVGKLIATLQEKGIDQDTTIIFSSDHGDFVGDYNMVGKHLFYEPAVRVPLIIQDSALPSGCVYDETVCLTDIRATMLHLAGITTTETDDSKVFSCYHSTTNAPRYVFGATDVGTMVTNHEWKLCRYKNGQVHLFHIKDDPDEVNNLADDMTYYPILKELDKVLQEKVIGAANRANVDKNVDCGDPAFPKSNWTRPYPVAK
ncbi:MAG: sulfatase-like hydrolase/transferase [Faecalibacterium sp.]